MEAGIGILFLIVVGIAIWALFMSMDKNRITEYIRERGGRIVSISWAPFGKGWFGEKEERIYEVVYYDAGGQQHFATCKTSMFTGVFWTDDRITHPKAKWYGRLPQHNDPGNPIIRHIPDPPENEKTETEVSEGLGPTGAGKSTAEPIDEEISRLQKRLAELEQKKRESRG